MFGWKEYSFGALVNDVNGKVANEQWKLIKTWKPFVRYISTNLITNKTTGDVLGYVDNYRCPEWVGEAITKQLKLLHPEKMKEAEFDETGTLVKK